MNANLQQLRRRARKHGLKLMKDQRMLFDRWFVVDIHGNFIVSNGSLSLEEIEAWLDDYENGEE